MLTIDKMNDAGFVKTGSKTLDGCRFTWKTANPPAATLGYAVDAILVADTEEGGYTVSIAQLPGVHSQGDDAASAIRNIVEAFRAVIASYKDKNKPIPWRTTPDKEANEEWFRVAV